MCYHFYSMHVEEETLSLVETGSQAGQNGVHNAPKARQF
jgi:hypothetical protein